MSFTTELKSAVKKSTEITNDTWRKSVVQAFTQTVIGTPVDTGRARNGWVFANGTGNSGAIGNGEPVNVSRIPDIGGVCILFNNLPYIERLEDGYSQQAPSGWVKRVVNQWPAIVRSNI